jgi:hypothetical protein
MLFAINSFSQTVHADRGGFSMGPESVSENGQRAIIAWNGTFEVLALSADIISSQESEVLEIMPLPSIPSIGEGTNESFIRVQELVNTYFELTWPANWLSRPRGYPSRGMSEDTPQITVLFQEQIGIHFLTTVKAREASELSEWLESFLEARRYNVTLPASLNGLLENYTQNEINFFVIDMITADSTLKTVEPLIYAFNSSRLYYPLLISNLFSGESEISIFTVTNNLLKQDSILGGEFSKNAQFKISLETVSEISPNMTGLFSEDPYITYFRFTGSLADLKEDLLAESQMDPPNIPIVILTALNLSWGSALILASLVWKKVSSSPAQSPMVSFRWIKVFLLLTAGIGAILICAGFLVPWGLMEFDGVLMPISAMDAIPELGGLGPMFNVFFPPAMLLCVLHFLYVDGKSFRTSMVTAFLGILAIVTILVSLTRLHTLDFGAFSTLTGYLFIAVAGLSSLWRAEIEPAEPGVFYRRVRLADYVVRRVFIAMVILVGITWVVFLILQLFPLEIRKFFFYLSYFVITHG